MMHMYIYYVGIHTYVPTYVLYVAIYALAMYYSLNTTFIILIHNGDSREPVIQSQLLALHHHKGTKQWLRKLPLLFTYVCT